MTAPQTAKASLMNEILKSSLSIPYPPGYITLIAFGKYLHGISITPFKTIGEFADSTLRFLETIHSSKKLTVIVGDEYRHNSIKLTERQLRGESKGTRSTFLIDSREKPLPALSTWRDYFLKEGPTKQELMNFLSREWSAKASPNVIIALTSRAYQNGSEIRELETSHEEADTRLFVHAKYIHQANATQSMVLDSNDTDVFILGIYFAEALHANIFFRKGIKQECYFLRHLVSLSIAEALPAFHAWTGCDSVETFFGKGKVRPYKKMLEKEEYIELFRSIGTTFNLTKDQEARCATFTSVLYSSSCRARSLPELRAMVFNENPKRGMDSYPPDPASLHQHNLRGNYQAGIFRRCMTAKPVIPLPYNHGWEPDYDGCGLKFCWYSGERLPSISSSEQVPSAEIVDRFCNNYYQNESEESSFEQETESSDEDQI